MQRPEESVDLVMSKTLKQWVAFSLLVLAVVVIFRLPILQRSVIDWDESVYLLVASSLVEGSLPYVEVWDHKQPFLYILFATSFIAPDPVVGMRLLGCFAIASTALLLAFIVRGALGGWFAPAIAAMLYGVGTLAPGGLATNAEILFAPLVVGAFTILVFRQNGNGLRASVGLRYWAIAGFLSGLAVQVKLTAASEILALLVIAVIRESFRNRSAHRGAGAAMSRVGFFGLGMLGPVVIPVVVYWCFGRLDEYLFANFGFNFAYTDLEIDRFLVIQAAIARQFSYGTGWLWIVGVLGILWLIYWAWTEGNGTFRAVVPGVAWLFAGALGIFAGGKFYDHHLLQALPPLVLLATLSTVTFVRRASTPVRVASLILLGGLFVASVFGVSRPLERIASAPDTSRAIGRFLVERLVPGDSVYVANSQPIIYQLSGAEIPTRYVLPAWVIRPELRARLGLDLDDFLDGVFDQRPTFVVMEQDHPWLPDGPFVELLIGDYLSGRYDPVARFDSIIVLQAIANRGRPDR